MRRQHGVGILVATCVVLVVPRMAEGWLRTHYEDAQIVERSTLIVVGHLKAGSIQCVSHDRPPGEGASWEFHATLMITHTLKGKAAAQEISIILHYGLDVLQAGKMNTPNAGWNLSDDFPKDSIQIVDGGSSAPGYMLTKDATQDAIWFLQQRAGLYGEQPGKGDYGIADPEEIQPVELKDYFMCYLAADAEGAVKAYAAQHADVAGRKVRYLDHLEIQRIAAVKDAGERVRRLMPIFVRGCWWVKKDEAQELMTAAGADAAGPPLVKLFIDPANAGIRSRILRVWSDTHYSGCVETLMALLNENETYWAGQQLEAGWWNKDVGTAVTEERRRRYGDVLDSVYALGALGDRRAKGTLESTLKRWQVIGMEDPQMVDAIKAALQALPAGAGGEM